MPRTCTVCAHPDLEAIDEALVSRQPYRAIAERHCLSSSAVLRHSQNHVSPALAALQAERERAGGERLVDRIEDLMDRADRLLSASEESGKVVQALAAVREMRALLELLGKASGELKPDGPQVVVNLISSDEWLAVRAVIFAALAAHPEARQAVATRLLELEAGG